MSILLLIQKLYHIQNDAIFKDKIDILLRFFIQKSQSKRKLNFDTLK